MLQILKAGQFRQWSQVTDLCVAEALPLREDLETALRLLRQVDSQLVTIAEE